MRTLEEIIRLKNQVSDLYSKKIGYKDCIFGYGISTVGQEEKCNESKKIEYCIRIYLKKNSPELKFKKKHKGARIYIKSIDNDYNMPASSLLSNS